MTNRSVPRNKIRSRSSVESHSAFAVMKIDIFAPFAEYKGIEGKRALVPQGVRAPFYSSTFVSLGPEPKWARRRDHAQLLQFKVQLHLQILPAALLLLPGAGGRSGPAVRIKHHEMPLLRICK